MSTSLIVLASILALFALVMIPFMMVRTNQQSTRDQHHAPAKQGEKAAQQEKETLSLTSANSACLPLNTFSPNSRDIHT